MTVYEYKLIPLNRQTGEPLFAFDDVVPQVTVNIEPLCFVMRAARAGEVIDGPVPEHDKTLTATSTAKALSEMFGADVYFRVQGDVQWQKQQSRWRRS
jgi:hypothetical protein